MREKGPKVIRWRGMSAWGDIQSFGGKRLQDGGFGPIGSNRGGARIRDSDELLCHDLWIPWDILP